jgi:hypothetical protein
MKALLILLSLAVLAGCGGKAAPTPTPTKTPMPTWTATTAPTAAPVVVATLAPAATVAPVAVEVETPAPVSLEALGAALGDRLLDSELDAAMERAITLGAANMTPDQLSFAVLAVLRRAPAWMDAIGGGAPVDDRMEVMLDACHQIAFTASLRTDNLYVRNALGDLATGCTGVRMAAIVGAVNVSDMAAVKAAVERVNAELTAQ